jgi:hypothetical protein
MKCFGLSDGLQSPSNHPTDNLTLFFSRRVVAL